MPDFTRASAEARAAVFSHSQIRHLMRVEFGRAQRYGYSISCLQMCVDRLEHLRDLYGYASKEAILDGVVGLVTEQTRGCDYLGRSSDDRIMAVLPHTDAAGAASTGKRLIEAVRALPFEAAGRSLKVTLSVGASHFEEDNTLFFDALVDASQAALDEATAAGGDRYAYREPT